MKTAFYQIHNGRRDLYELRCYGLCSVYTSTWSLPMSKPLGQPQAIKAKVDKVGNRLIATTTSLADMILLGNRQPNLIEVVN